MLAQNLQKHCLMEIVRIVKQNEECNLEHELISKEIEQKKMAMLERSKTRRLIQRR